MRLLLHAVATLFLVGATGCLGQTLRAGTSADASIAGIRAEMRDVRTALVQMETTLHAGRDVNQNDKWTLRLLGAGLLLMGLTYPVGKIVWLVSASLSRRTVVGRWMRPDSPGEYFAFRARPVSRAEAVVPA